MAKNPEKFKKKVQESLNVRLQQSTGLPKGMYFLDYGNAFLLEASRAGADILKDDGSFIYPSYVQDIMGPMCFDYGFGPFRWVCTSVKLMIWTLQTDCHKGTGKACGRIAIRNPAADA